MDGYNFWDRFFFTLMYNPFFNKRELYRVWSTYNSMGTNPIRPDAVMISIAHLPICNPIQAMKYEYYKLRFANIAQIKIPVLQQLAFNRLQEEINQLKTAV